MKKNVIKLTVLAIIFCCFSSVIFAAGKPKKSGNSETGDWQFEITPYLWTAGLSGDIKIGKLPESTVDASPSDILKSLDFGFMGTFEARKNRFGFILDAMYINLSQSLPSNIFSQVDAEITQQIYAFAGAYHVTPENYIPIDLIAGARYLSLKLKLDVERNIFPSLPSKFGADDQVNWWDGFLGMRAFFPLTDNLKLVGYADIGAGGSKMSWQALAGMNYDFTKNISGKFGYRILSEDYEKNKLVYDMRMGGFYLGLGIKF